MTDERRVLLRTLQSRWLALPEVKRQIEIGGWDHPIAMPNGSPTFADVRSMVLPDWMQWFRDFIEDRK